MVEAFFQGVVVELVVVCIQAVVVEACSQGVVVVVVMVVFGCQVVVDLAGLFFMV